MPWSNWQHKCPKPCRDFWVTTKLLSHFDTYIASQLFDIRLTIIVGIMITILALGVSVSDEASGRMKTFMSLPISRTKLFVQRWLAMVFIIAVELLVMVLSVLALQGTVDASIAVGELAKLLPHDTTCYGKYGVYYVCGRVCIWQSYDCNVCERAGATQWVYTHPVLAQQ